MVLCVARTFLSPDESGQRQTDLLQMQRYEKDRYDCTMKIHLDRFHKKLNKKLKMD